MRLFIVLIIFSIFLTGCVQLHSEIVSEVEENIPGVFNYVLRGEKGSVNIELNSELKQYLAGISREYPCSPVCPPEIKIQQGFLDDKKQKSYLIDLVEQIKSKTDNKDDQARIAVSLVQHISYDAITAERYFSDFGNYARLMPKRYPYEVLYDNTGVCEEKARLLAFILRELGYGVVLFEFEHESHMAVGIKCESHDFKGTGYCFIETTKPTIITHKVSLSTFEGNIEISSYPKVIIIKDGPNFDSSEEFNDKKELKRIIINEVVSEKDYNKFLELRNKYDLFVI